MGDLTIHAACGSRRSNSRVALLVTAAMGILLVGSAEAQVPTIVTPLPEFGARALVAADLEHPAQPPTGPAENSETVIRILLEKAYFWRSQYQLDRAAESLSRVLQLDKDNADALAMLAPIQAKLGLTAAAQDSLTHLRRAHPNDPQIASAEQSLRIGELDQAQLAQARSLTSDGHASDALKIYQRVFKGDTPPPELATEYYLTLGGSEGGFDQAHDALSRLVIRNPQDIQAQLAFAQIQTFRESTRIDGVKRLEMLVTTPAAAEEANKALRGALTWLSNDPATVDSLEAYLRRNPDDAQLKAKLEFARNPPGKARQDAFDALNKNRLGEAEAGFAHALTLDPDDKDALGGLGLVRQRQGRLPEARELLSHAAQIDPGWEPALGGLNYQPNRNVGADNPGGSSGADNAAGRAIAAQYARVNVLARSGQSGQAEALLAKLMGQSGNWGNWGNYLQLGTLQAQQGKLADAESSFRRSIRMNPRDTAAVAGLAGVLAREDRGEEAKQLLSRIGSAPGTQGVVQIHTADLRKQAEAEIDPARRLLLLQEAVASDPSFPWTRLDLARALDSQGQHDQARQVMDGTITGSHPTKDQIQASMIYAQEHSDFARAAQLIEYVPVKDRTPEMKSLQRQAALLADINGAVGAGGADVTRARLLQVASRPDPTGTRVGEVAKRLLALNDKAGAREAVRLGLANTQPQTSAQQLAYIGPLLDAGYKQEAKALAGQVNTSSLSPLQRISFEGLQNGIAIQQSDALNLEGKRAAAYDTLAPRLASKPNAPDLNMALSRLYTSAKKPEQALRINEAVLERDPGDLDVRRAAVGSSIQAGDYGHANELIAIAEQQSPDDYRTQLMVADMARARGNTGRALSALRRARELRLQQVNGGIGG